VSGISARYVRAETPDATEIPDAGQNGGVNRLKPSTILASVFFTGAGVMHFFRPDFFESIVPDWFPNRKLANQVSGAAEIALGLGLLPQQTRRVAALAMIGLVTAVFPANIDMAVHDVEVLPVDGKMTRSVGTAEGSTRVINWVRLPLQIPLAVALWRLARTRE
jgi:uncharacterized membrane protein